MNAIQTLFNPDHRGDFSTNQTLTLIGLAGLASLLIAVLPLGGLIGYVAVVTRQELMLFIAGGVFVLEAISVLSQVGYYKWTGGRRLFRCAPIHHHFHLGGWSEPQTVVRFWLLAAMFAGFALVTIKLR